MEHEEARVLCWIFGSAGVVATGVLHALYWWQATEVTSARDPLFRRSLVSLPSSLLLFLYCLSLTPSPEAPPTAATSGGGAPPAHWEVLPHTSLLSAAIACSVSLCGLSLCLLSYALDHSKRQTKAALSITVGVILGAWMLIHFLPLSIGPMQLLSFLTASSCILLPVYCIALELSTITCKGCAPRGSISVASAELVTSILWSAYGGSSGDGWITGAFAALVMLELLLLLVLIFVRGPFSHSESPGAEGYELISQPGELQCLPLSDEMHIGHGGDSHPNLLNFEDLDRQFDDWLQTDVVSGKRTL